LEENYSREPSTNRNSVNEFKVKVKEDDAASSVTILHSIQKTDDPDLPLGEIKLHSIIVKEEPPDEKLEDKIDDIIIPSESLVP